MTARKSITDGLLCLPRMSRARRAHLSAGVTNSRGNTSADTASKACPSNVVARARCRVHPRCTGAFWTRSSSSRFPRPPPPPPRPPQIRHRAVISTPLLWSCIRASGASRSSPILAPMQAAHLIYIVCAARPWVCLRPRTGPLERYPAHAHTHMHVQAHTHTHVQAHTRRPLVHYRCPAQTRW